MPAPGPAPVGTPAPKQRAATPSRAGRLAAVRDLVEAVGARGADVADRIRRLFPDISAKPLSGAPAAAGGGVPGTNVFSTAGHHVAVWGTEAVFALCSDEAVDIAIDGGPPRPMARVAGTPYLVHRAEIATGSTHRFEYRCNGRTVSVGDVAGYTADSYDTTGAPGSLSERRQVTSHIYPGAVTDYWVYTNPGAGEHGAAPVMVWLDGEGYVGPSDLVGHRLQVVSDNLARQGRIPPMAHVLVSPSQPGEELPLRYPGQTQQIAMRGLQYDTVSRRYGRHLLEEVLPDAARVCRLRSDGYARACAGLSSAATAAFTLAWLYPADFSRAHCGIGSFTALLWGPEQDLDRGHLLPYFVRQGPARNIRVWLSDGAADIEAGPDQRPELHRAGSWPLANLEMANALKLGGYDFHFRFGTAGHNLAQTALDLPESLTWLWRGYDPARASEVFRPDEVERQLPVYRFAITNRPHW